MRDITLCNYGNPKKLRNGLCNFSKLRILVQMVVILCIFSHLNYTSCSLKRYISINVLNTTIHQMTGPEIIVPIFLFLMNTSKQSLTQY